jgi:hypothetical protein
MKHEIPVLDAKGLRQFGLTTGAIVAGLFGLIFPFLLDHAWPIWPWVVFGTLALWALVAPSTLNPVYRGWMHVGLLLGKVTTPIVLTLVFLIAILPAALILRILGKDPMRRSFDESDTYRVKSKQPTSENLEKPY